MMRSHRKIEFIVVAVFVLCAWFLFNAHFNENQKELFAVSVVEKPWRDGVLYAEEGHKIFQQSVAQGGTEEEASSTSTAPQRTSPLTQITAVTTPSSSRIDRVVVMAKLPTYDTRWVHTDLKDWKSAIYDIDTETPHNKSTLDPLTNSTLRTLRNKGMEANAYLAYIVQNYNNLPSTIAFIHPHKDGYPIAWHTDNNEHSNVVSLKLLNINFIQSNGYANMRCVNDPGCPHEVMPFRDPPEDHRTIEAAMPDA
ncbi:hypothetical protein PMIN03_006213 [Paraphaeosphaeria minitans]